MPPNSMHSLQYTVVDAFTDKVFGGNPAAVIILNDAARANLDLAGGGDRTLQLIAREFNLSETVYISPVGTAPDQVPTFGLRWFTPKSEVGLCGHATMAAAHTLFKTPAILPADASLIHFQTLSGTLTAKRLADEKIELEFPAGLTVKADEAVEKKVRDMATKAIAEEHGVTFVGVGKDGSFKLYMTIELQAPFDLQNATVNPGALLELAPRYQVITLTVKSASSNSYACRTFVPYLGVPEDPVCGSAHCMLGPYWHQKFGLRTSEVIRASHVSERSGVLDVVWNQERSTCKLIGRAKTAINGEIFLPASNV